MMQIRSRRLAPKNQQRGTFAIELAFVLVCLCAIFLFSTDLSYQLLVRAKLDRSSFALVNILKERSRYFDGDVSEGRNISVSSTELNDFKAVASRMLAMPVDKVALRIESLDGKSIAAEYSTEEFKALSCGADDIVDYADLAPEDKGTVYPLYRITLCEQHDSWFSSFVVGAKPSSTIVSSSIIAGR
jgi:tight adherence protein F